MRFGDFIHHHRSLFSLRDHGPDPRGSAGDGAFSGAHGPVSDRDSRDPCTVDLCVLPAAQVAVFSVHLLSGILDRYHHHAGGLLLVCEEEMHPAASGGTDIKRI